MPPIEDELRSAWEEDGHDRVPPLDLGAVHRRGRGRARRRVATVAGGVAVAAVGVVLAVQAAGSLAPAPPAEPTTTSTTAEPTDPATDGSTEPSSEPETSTPPHGWAEVVPPSGFVAIPEDGWWREAKTASGYTDHRSHEHPDTILVAGFAQAVVEGYVRDPETGAVEVVPASELAPIEVDPGWPSEWIVLDAHTLEIVDKLDEFDTQARTDGS